MKKSESDYIRRMKRAQRRFNRRKHVNYTKCSCYLCGNPRKWGERTIAEKKQDEAFRHDCSDHSSQQ